MRMKPKKLENGILRAALSLMTAVGLSDLAAVVPEITLRPLDIAYEMRRRIDTRQARKTIRR